MINFVLLGLMGFIVLTAIMLIVTRYKRCPSDKILVIYGKTGEGSAKCVAGGAAFVWPIIQSYEYLDLSPISIDVDLRGALSKQNIRVSVPSRFTVAVSNEPGVMVNAAERLLGKPTDEIREIAKDIIFGQLRLVVATMDIEEINSDRDKFLTNVTQNVGSELRKIGLSLINVNVTDIQDESGYIEALGKEAAAKAINDAKKSVAEKDRDGSVGQAIAMKNQRIEVASANSKADAGEADATKYQRIKTAEAESTARIGEAVAKAKAIEGENESKILIAQSDAFRREREAEAEKTAIASEKVQKAHALEEAYAAEQKSEEARANKERASQVADIVVKAEIYKRKIELEAEAEAEKIRRIAKGEAEALFMKKKAEADGLFEILKKQADGFNQIVGATNGNPREAVLMLIADKLPELVKTQVEAIKGIKIDKVTVWENGSQNSDSGNSTSKFISGLYKSVPPMKDLFDMAGMELPEYLGKETASSAAPQSKNGAEEKESDQVEANEE